MKEPMPITCKWEYLRLSINVSDLSYVTEQLNKLGSEGWDLVHIHSKRMRSHEGNILYSVETWTFKRVAGLTGIPK
jgi:hypothetical protein